MVERRSRHAARLERRADERGEVTRRLRKRDGVPLLQREVKMRNDDLIEAHSTDSCRFPQRTSVVFTDEPPGQVNEIEGHPQTSR